MSFRGFSPGTTVHVLQRGNNKGRIFDSAKDSALYLEWLTEAAQAFGLSVHAYVLMTNHIHLLASLGSKDSLARVMQSVGIRYTRYFNGTRERTGTLWEGRYRSCVIEREDDFLACSRYIEMNPVRAGLAAAPEVYRWSSYKANATGREDALVTHHDVYQRLGTNDDARRASYRALFEKPSQDFDDRLRAATNRGIGLDGVDQIRKVGRPRKAA
jgi:putative transposase